MQEINKKSKKSFMLNMNSFLKLKILNKNNKNNETQNGKKKKRTIAKSVKIYHKVNKRSGFYSFVFKNFIKLIVILSTIIVLIILLDKILIASGIDMKSNIEKIISKTNTVWVLIVFFVSESILGWIPPDFFITWAQSKPCDYAYLNVTLLASLSYLGGYVAYRLGELIRKSHIINSYIEKRNTQYFFMIRKWGGIVIIMAALFPLPFATVSTIAGIVNYPLKNYLIFGLSRFLRFYIYAAWIFWALDNLI